MMGSSRGEIQGAQFTVMGPELSPDGLVIPAVGTGPFRATFTPPREGTYEVQFEARVEGRTVRAHRTLPVSQ